MTVGRPREFDADQVEDASMKLFWERGFDGVSISDVTAATGVAELSGVDTLLLARGIIAVGQGI